MNNQGYLRKHLWGVTNSPRLLLYHYSCQTCGQPLRNLYSSGLAVCQGKFDKNGHQIGNDKKSAFTHLLTMLTVN